MFPETPEEFSRLIDHTVLAPDSTRRDARRIAEEALAHRFASACVLPNWVADAADILEGSGVGICTVVGFPHGNAPAQAKAAEAANAMGDGATEIDMVVNISALKSGADLLVMSDIEAVVEAASYGEAVVKVILECALLTDDEKRRVCRFAQEAGAGYVKTSTGFSVHGATAEDVALMRQVVGAEMGVKAAGGIRTLADARKLVEAGASRLGTSAGVALLEAFLAARA
jgi:deoxyribose-phosphate aldolase